MRQENTQAAAQEPEVTMESLTQEAVKLQREVDKFDEALKHNQTIRADLMKKLRSVQNRITSLQIKERARS